MNPEGILWKVDYDDALAQAGKQRRLLVVHFWLGGRPLVKSMNDETFTHPEVTRISNAGFVNLKVDIASRPDLFERTVEGRGGLATCVLDASGDVVSVLHGYADPQTYLRFLRKAESGYPKLKVAREAASRRPGDLAALQLLAETYLELGSSRRAEECLQKLLHQALKGNQPGASQKKLAAYAHERVARLRALRGKNREAALHVLEYRKLDPGTRFGRHDRVLLTEALIAWIERRLRDALLKLEEGLEKFPGSQERDQMLLAMGVVLHESGSDAAALQVLEKLLREYPSSQSIEQAKDQISHIKNPPLDHTH
jgi:tetratricopeptide (TPR) repeat protein